MDEHRVHSRGPTHPGPPTSPHQNQELSCIAPVNPEQQPGTAVNLNQGATTTSTHGTNPSLIQTPALGGLQAPPTPFWDQSQPTEILPRVRERVVRFLIPPNPRMSTITLREIASVPVLYYLKHLIPNPSSNSPYPPSQSLNNKIKLIRNDITRLAVACIVNAANESLLGGGGVDGAIHRAAGPQLLAECRTFHGCPTGSAQITGAYELPCDKVIHAVGPIYWSTKKEGKHTELLASCYKRSLDLAVCYGCKSIAFSALSTGVYGYPSEEAAIVALGTVREFLSSEQGAGLESVVFCSFEKKDQDAYNKLVP